MSEWISVEERLPEVGTDVLMTNGSVIAVAFCLENNFGKKYLSTWDDGWTGCETHWMPLPEPPE